ncbi:MAG: chemotaxis response regulator protein-glutamate methylesterase [Paracoccaceae bacterium]
MSRNRKCRVLIVDDSAVVRETLSQLINRSPHLEVMATANDPFEAAQRIKDEVPDVITLDVEMPRMDGITFLRRLMAQKPIPVVICSSLVGEGTKTMMAAMDAGAVDIVQKPAVGTKKFLEESAIVIQDKILGASQARLGVRRGAAPRTVAAPRANTGGAGPSAAMYKTTQTIVAIGASTGGTEALRHVLTSLPPFSPPIVIVQHMPEHFTAAFAKRLDEECQISVKEARDGDRALRGQALIAPGNHHLTLTRSGAEYGVRVTDGPLVSRHRPSVDVLFRSMAKYAGSNAVGVIMTGMGDDGAQGLKTMREAGARTIGQDEGTCVVYGMSRVAKQVGAVEQEMPIERISEALVHLGQERAA